MPGNQGEYQLYQSAQLEYLPQGPNMSQYFQSQYEQ